MGTGEGDATTGKPQRQTQLTRLCVNNVTQSCHNRSSARVFPCRVLRQPNLASGDSFWLHKAMLQTETTFGVNLHRKGGLLTMDTSPPRQWCHLKHMQSLLGALVSAALISAPSRACSASLRVQRPIEIGSQAPQSCHRKEQHP